MFVGAHYQKQAGQQPMLGRRTGMEIFYLSRCCRRRAKVAGAEQMPSSHCWCSASQLHPEEISQWWWRLLVKIETRLGTIFKPTHKDLKHANAGKRGNNPILLIYSLKTMQDHNRTPSKTVTTVDIGRTRCPCDACGACVQFDSRPH